MNYMGVDPGKGGALAVISGELLVLGLHPMPVFAASARKGKKRSRAEYDLESISRLLGLHGNGGVFVTLEKGQPLPPKMGGSLANYQRGYGRGLFEGMLVALGIPYQLVAPRTWQALCHAGTPGDDLKQKSIIAAQRLFPGVDLRRTERSTTPHDGKAEALLIAFYGMRSQRPEVWSDGAPA